MRRFAALFFALAFVLVLNDNCQRKSLPKTVRLPEPAPVAIPDFAQFCSDALPLERRFSSNFVPALPDTLPFIHFNAAVSDALLWQERYLRKPQTPNNPVKGFFKNDLLAVVEHLRSQPYFDVEELAQHFDFLRFNSTLPKDRVRVTGYYTPQIEAQRTRKAPFLFPVLKKPEGKKPLPSPEAIEKGALDHHAIAWVKSRKAVRDAQLQGSCLLEFPDGENLYLGFGGSTRGKGRCYVFFTPVDKQVLGAQTLPVTPGHTVALDTRVAPLGSCLLAELPNLDAAGKLLGYTYRIVLAQDRGSAIRTTNRVDLYCGVGREALVEARKINQYGRFWVLVPKKDGVAVAQKDI